MTKDSIQLAYAYNNLGDVYLLSGNLPLAHQYGLISLEIFKKIGDKSGIAYGYMNMGEVCREMNEFQESLDYFKKAAIVRKEMNTISRMGYILYNQAKTYEESGSFDSAMIYYKQALNCNYGSLNYRFVSWSLNGVADIYYSEGDYEMANRYYSEALEWNKSRRHNFGIIDNYIGLALVCAHKEENEKGADLLNKALSLALKCKINSQIIKSYGAFIEYYKITGNYEDVIRSFDMFLLQYDSILLVQQFEISDVLESSYSMQHDLLESEQELKINNIRRVRLLVIVVLLIITMLILVYFYQSNRKMNRKLADMNKTKDKLFSVISHDLKSPFNILIGFSEILMKEINDKNYEKSSKYAGYLNNASVEGLNLLTNLLNWSRSQNGGFHFSPELIDINELFHDMEEFFRIQVEKYNVSLNFKNSISHKVSIDSNILRIILVNLITNALKYTDEKGIICITAIQENNLVKIKVKDTGVGMSDEILNQLFDKTSFIESKKGLRKEKGTGLGLSIVSELIQIHKGSISVESEEGNGSTFAIEIPSGVSD